MNFINKIFNKLRRETSTGFFMPEIDGLRFIAVMMVVLYHINLFLVNKSPYFTEYPNNLIYFIFSNGFKGVEIFFAISGFILALPFAKQYLMGDKKVELKKYFWRRLTRLEPPYFVVLMIFLVLHIIKGVYPVDNLLRGLVENIFYVYNLAILPNTQSVIGMVGWTLELEVQFYILAPLFARMFKFKNITRQVMIIISILALPALNLIFKTPFVWLFNYLYYFGIGFLLADIIVNKTRIYILDKYPLFFGICSFAALFLADINGFLAKYIFIFALFTFIYLALTSDIIKKFLSFRIFTTIGGMCYSIYLVHTVIISGFGSYLVRYKFGGSYVINLFVHCLILVPVVLFLGTIFYMLFEKPFMDRKWPAKFLMKIKSIFTIKVLDKEEEI